MSSDLALYYPMSPNPESPGCMVTGEATDGVVFANVLDVNGMPFFIGRQAVYEAAAELTGFTVKQLRGLEKVREENKALREEVAKLQQVRSEFNALKVALEEAGLVYRELE